MRKFIFIFSALFFSTATAIASDYTTITISSDVAPVVSYSVFYPVNNRCDGNGAANPIAQIPVTGSTEVVTVEKAINSPGNLCFSFTYVEKFFVSVAYSPVKRVELITTDNKINVHWSLNDRDYEVSFGDEKTPVTTVRNAGNKSYGFRFYQPLMDSNNIALNCHDGYGAYASDNYTIVRGSEMDAIPVSPLYDLDNNLQVCLHVKSGVLVYTHGPFKITPDKSHFTIIDHLNVKQE